MALQPLTLKAEAIAHMGWMIRRAATEPLSLSSSSPPRATHRRFMRDWNRRGGRSENEGGIRICILPPAVHTAYIRSAISRTAAAAALAYCRREATPPLLASEPASRVFRRLRTNRVNQEIHENAECMLVAYGLSPATSRSPSKIAAAGNRMPLCSSNWERDAAGCQMSACSSSSSSLQQSQINGQFC